MADLFNGYNAFKNTLTQNKQEMEKIYMTLRTTRTALLLLLTGILLLAANAGLAQTVTLTTDKLDYAPGEIVHIEGTGWFAGETVNLLIMNLTYPALNSLDHYRDWNVVVDDQGNFSSWWDVTEDELNTELVLTALGDSSGYREQVFFTDGSEPKINSISPLSGRAGDVVTIVLNQSASTISSVYFGSDNGTNISLSANGKTITVTVPNGYGSVDVTVNGYWDDKGTATSFTDTFKDPFSIDCSSPTVVTNPINQTVTYGDDAIFTIAAGGTETLSYQWQVSTDGGVTWANTGTNSATLSVSNPTVAMSGYQYQCVVTGQCDPIATSAPAVLTVNPRAITIIADAKSKVYGESDPEFTFQIAAGNLVGSDVFSGLLERISGESAGTYAISQGTVTLPGGNYTISFSGADFTITTKAASVTPNTASKEYGSADPALTGTLSGFLTADNVTAAYSRVAGETVLGGPYTISAVLSPTEVLSNYDITYNTADFTITTKAASVTPNTASKEYGSADPALTGTLSGFLTADNVTAAYSRVAGETVLGGPYTISAVLSPTEVLSNYDITYNTADFTITTKAASVTPNTASKYCGQPDPTFNGTLDGFITSDNVEAMYSRTQGESVIGSPYTISAVLSPTAILDNYNITYNTAEFIIKPVSIDASASSTPIQQGTDATLYATVTDESANPIGSVLVTFYIDDVSYATSWTNGDGLASLTSVPVPDVHVYKITAIAGEGCSESTAYLPVYDPSAGFVTGGGWIWSPKGAYAADETLDGKANFGFVAKYKKGKSDVDGNTEFHFHAAGMKFKSQFHESGSLVISGGKATYRGEGTINGEGSYKFTLVAFDGDWNDGNDPDRFRIKIWGDAGIVYDNAIGSDDNSDDATELGGGSIVIHEVKSNNKTKSAEIATAVEPIEISDPGLKVYPNPFKDRARFEFVSPVAALARIDVYNMAGQRVQTIFDGWVEENTTYNAEFKPVDEISGMYIYRMQLGNSIYNGKLVYKKE